MERKTQIIYTNIPEHEQPESFGLSSYNLEKWLLDPSNKYYFNIWIRNEEIPQHVIEYTKTYPNFYLFLNDSLEGFAKRTFPKIHSITISNKIENKVIYVTGHLNAKEEYSIWLDKNKIKSVFEVISNNQWFYRIKDQMLVENIQMPIDKSEWICSLNHRGHKHRILTVDYLKKHNITTNVSALWKNQIVDIANDQEVIISHHYSRVHSNCLINLTTETYYDNHWNDYNEMFITEKTWKTIVAKQVFVIIGPRGILKKLKELGFKTFEEFIDESYDNEPDSTRLYSAINSTITAMKTYSLEELNEITRQTREYNVKWMQCISP